MLEVAGLDGDEERGYRCLVQLAAARARDIAEALAIPVPAASKVLDLLRDKGLAVESPGDDPVYRPLPPDVALGPSLLRHQEALDVARLAVTQLADEFRESVRRHDADQLVEIITGAEALRVRLRHVQDSAREEMMWFCRANPVAMGSEENAEEFAALSRGVRYRVIYERPLLEEPGMLQNIALGIRAGEVARAVPELPVRLAIADRSVAICPLVRGGGDGPGQPTAAVIGRSQLLDALIALFERYWEAATALGPEGPVKTHSDGPAEEERLLLSLFVAGVPDKSIASQLRVSRRTVQRRLADLMELAGVDTRPGLAFQAASRGWI